MPDEFAREDLKTIWQNQQTEIPAMTLKLIRSKARDLQSKTRRKLVATLSAPLVACVLYWFAMKRFSSIENLLQPLFVIAIAWSLVGLYFVNRGMWAASMPGDAGLNTGLTFCREEIARQRDVLRRVLVWSLGPTLLALATFVWGLSRIGGSLRNAAPFLILTLAWIAAYFVQRDRELRVLKREMEDLGELATDERR